MSSVIAVEHLSKKYIIGHQKQEPYTALRDVLANGMKRFAHKLRHPFAGPENDIAHEEFWALKDISFDVQQGDRVGVIGRNGAGKSTLLKILSRITEPTSGRVSIKGRVASLLEVGTGFHPELSGRENIFLNGAILGMSKAEIKKSFDEIVAFADVEKFLDTPVKHYSSGMYVRLAFAVAAHLEPEILIVDEVLAVGDAQFQKKCMNKMESVGKEGRTIIFVSHNIGAVRALCSRAVLLHKGELVIDDEPSIAITNYVSHLRAEEIKVVESVAEKGVLQNGSAIVTKIEVCDNTHRAGHAIDTDTPFQINVYYTVKNDGAFVGLNLIVRDSDSNCVFASISNHEKNWYGQPMPKGDYKSICHIPKHFLNNGLYSMDLALFGNGFSDLVSTGELLVIEIQDGKEVRGDYFGGYTSATRPLFEWVTVQSV